MSEIGGTTTIEMQPGWPDSIERRCSHCGATGDGLLCVELEAAALLFAVCDTCAPSLASMLINWTVERAQKTPSPPELAHEVWCESLAGECNCGAVRS